MLLQSWKTVAQFTVITGNRNEPTREYQEDTSIRNVLYYNRINKEPQPPPICNDIKAPCKCKPEQYETVSKSGHVHHYIVYTCLENQDSSIQAKLHKLHLQCTQLLSTKKLEYCDKGQVKNERVIEYNSGCEVRYIDAPKIS